MNDFSKDELRHIGDALLYGMAVLDSRKDVLMAIRGKVLEMIDNYCNHECDHNWIVCFYGEDKIPINLCSLCNLRERR